MSNKLIIIFGPPGSGKGTQSSLLAEKKKLFHLETSKILENKFLNVDENKTIKIEGKNCSLKEQKRRWKDGLLCEDEFVNHVIRENLEDLRKKGMNILLDGYPRTTAQVSLALPLFLSLYNASDILTLFLEVDEEESAKRNTNRRVCSLMRHSIVNLPETEALTVCPIDGSPLEKRVMDDPETIRIRLKEFEKKTLPVIKSLDSNNIPVSRINGVGTIDEVFSRVLKKIEGFEL